MAIALQRGLPAEATLHAEGVKILARNSTPGASDRVRVLLVNLMPTKEVTETQFARLLGNCGQDVEMTLCIPDSYRPKNVSAEHMASFYRPFSELRDQRFDAMIVTGAPVETLDFKEVEYWDELTEIIEWAQGRVARSLFICWAAQAALHHFHRVAKHELDQKVFGVFPQEVAASGHALLKGFGREFLVPVSRHTEIRASDLPEEAGLTVLAGSDESGICMIEDRHRAAIYLFNHFEYDADTLDLEYRRDVTRGQAIEVPRNYYPGDDPERTPANIWRPFARLFFQNWVADIAERKKRAGRRPAAIDWLFGGAAASSHSGAGRSELRIHVRESRSSLPVILRRLSTFGSCLESARVLANESGGEVVELRIAGLSGAGCEALARGLAEDEGVDGVSFRTQSGEGGIVIHEAEHDAGNEASADFTDRGSSGSGRQWRARRAWDGVREESALSPSARKECPASGKLRSDAGAPRRRGEPPLHQRC